MDYHSEWYSFMEGCTNLNLEPIQVRLFAQQNQLQVQQHEKIQWTGKSNSNQTTSYLENITNNMKTQGIVKWKFNDV